MVEALLVRRHFEPLARREDRDIGNPVATFARPVTAKRVARLRREEIACNLRAAAPGGGDDCSPVCGSRVGVVDDDRSPGGQSGVGQLVLAPLRLPLVAPRMLTDQPVRGGESFTIERRFA